MSGQKGGGELPGRPRGLKWSAAHRTAAQMRASGHAWPVIGEALHRKRNTVERYATLEGFRELVEHYRREQFKQREREVLSAGQTAIADLQRVRDTAWREIEQLVARREQLLMAKLAARLERVADAEAFAEAFDAGDEQASSSIIRAAKTEEPAEDMFALEISALLQRATAASQQLAKISGYQPYRTIVARWEAEQEAASQRASQQRDLLDGLDDITDEDEAALTRLYHEAIATDPSDR